MSGETITCNLVVDNKSSNKIARMNVSLVREVNFEARECTKKSRRVSHTLASVQYEKQVRPQSRETWQSIELVVPTALHPSSSTRLIKICYYVQVELYGSIIHSPKFVRIPIVIGTLGFGYSSNDYRCPIEEEPTFSPPRYEEMFHS